ncbi:hypothetical protein ACIBH1_04870 [Nonomuraea sp. NPDC050663]|uniref:Uncharacterized protein n=1 Tax=Nonomuraea soli TaxID=1032476 RepID=A0A7W0HMN6_9ACTN|nr:hypothetical protein [Nonomuraea soli]MBA2888940.1 hypothetical protein [Nonomuraea soli]
MNNAVYDKLDLSVQCTSDWNTLVADLLEQSGDLPLGDDENAPVAYWCCC